MPIIQIDMRRGRTREQKDRMAVGLTRAVHEICGAPLASISVVVRELPGPDTYEAGEPSPEYLPGPDGADLAGAEDARQRAGEAE